MKIQQQNQNIKKNQKIMSVIKKNQNERFTPRILCRCVAPLPPVPFQGSGQISLYSIVYNGT